MAERVVEQAPAGDIELRREMSITHADFRRLLPVATPGWRVTGRDDRFEISSPDEVRQLSIELGPERQRSIGALSLPQTLVTLRFQGFDQGAFGDFIKRFDLAYQRGGG